MKYRLEISDPCFNFDGGSASGMIQSGGGLRLHEDEHLTCGGAESHFGDPTDGGVVGGFSDPLSGDEGGLISGDEQGFRNEGMGG